ncbi:uncharacterized protein LOC117567954 [Drosophila albomicans]|uniref:Uncharacterized protein LOC117567954 n=1 Tax=Drosophila albomicans TaxID=7291 RepID=A0A6P8WNH1_DROAB|nr:uncharacterized protein LOC117567954 [Drosophila albomicans]
MRTFFAVILLALVSGSWSLCNLNIREPFPVVAKTFGSKTAILKQLLTEVELSNNETVTFYCPQGVRISGPSNGYNNPSDDYYDPTERTIYRPTVINQPTADLTCGNDGIYLDEQRIIEVTSGGHVSCNADVTRSLYESNVSLIGCDPVDAMTLVIGYKLKRLTEVKLLALCYDLSASQLRFVNFLAYPAKNVLLTPANTDEVLGRLQLDNIVSGLDKYFSYITVSQFNELSKQQTQLGELYDAEMFDYSSLLQDQQQQKDLEQYNHLLNIVWLRNLRKGNWKHWLQALRAANDDDDDKFELRIGVSGMATMPLGQRCNVSRSLQLLDSNSGNSLQVPAHVWAHVRSLQPTGTVADEFVLVAHNSPYVDVLQLSTFCDDICHEIPWLRKSLFAELHLLPIFGVVHCCRVDQVDKLTDFAYGKQKQQQAQQQQQLSDSSPNTTTARPLIHV